MLFDTRADPGEFYDLGDAPQHAKTRARLYGHLTAWGLRMAQLVSRSETEIDAMRGRSARRGMLPFLVDGSKVPPDLTVNYRGPARQDHLTEAAGARDADDLG